MAVEQSEKLHYYALPNLMCGASFDEDARTFSLSASTVKAGVEPNSPSSCPGKLFQSSNNGHINTDEESKPCSSSSSSSCGSVTGSFLGLSKDSPCASGSSFKPNSLSHKSSSTSCTLPRSSPESDIVSLRNVLQFKHQSLPGTSAVNGIGLQGGQFCGSILPESRDSEIVERRFPLAGNINISTAFSYGGDFSFCDRGCKGLSKDGQFCDASGNIWTYLPPRDPEADVTSRLLSEWNDSPLFVRGTKADTLSDDFSSEESPWHIDLNEVDIGDMVATGSYGMVYKGIYKARKVAVKVLLIPEASSAVELNKLKAGFRQEIDVWYTLSHPNIVQFIGAHINPPKWAIVTEFLDGGSLKAFLMRQQHRKLSRERVVAMALNIARGMEYLHQSNIMHRDLKSANLLLDEDGTVKVADFGLARLEAEDPGNLTAETGTIRWMAPEVISHMPYTRKVDVYSFGIVLWELCTSQVPFEGLSFVQLAHAVANDNYRPPTDDCPPTLIDLMTKCWDRDASKRPDFPDIVKALEEVHSSEDSKFSLKSLKTLGSPAREVTYPVDAYSRPTVSMRGGKVLGRTRNVGPSLVANTDDLLSDEEEWVGVRRQCQCTIM